MKTESTQKRLFKAAASINFPKVQHFLEPILTSIATHDMTVTPYGDSHRVISVFGTAEIKVQPGKLLLSIETENKYALNRLKHALVGPITFIAASEKLVVQWYGDETGFTPLEDLRVLRVKDISQLTPRMRRIVFQGEDLARFDRDDQLHCRLIFQPKNTHSPEWPVLDDAGHIVWPKQHKLDTRVYTIRAINAANGEITIDFALHQNAGPATQWAISATAGDTVGVVGPAAGGPNPAKFYVLAGDETGLPGIARILENLDKDTQGFVFIEIDNPSEVQTLTKLPRMKVQWLYRHGAAAGTTRLLPDAVRSVAWPNDLDDVFFWGGCEHKAFRVIHRFLQHEVKLPRKQQILFSHWHRTLSEEEIIAIGGKAYLPET
ncbi:siderophore-interacting protein [Brucellaceae bacterium D45D]